MHSKRMSGVATSVLQLSILCAAAWILSTTAHAAEAANGDLNVHFVTPRGDKDPGLMGRYEDAPASDGKIRLRAFWTRSAPAHDILSETGDVFRSSKQDGWTFEFYVLVENAGKEDVVVPSPVDRSPRSMGMPVGDGMIVPYLVKFSDFMDRVTFVDSEVTFRPVKLKPGEFMRLPIYYFIKDNLDFGPQWFFYGVDETIAKRFGWWSGALKCRAREYTAALEDEFGWTPSYRRKKALDQP